MPLFQYFRRRWITSRPFPAEWHRLLHARVPVYRKLPAPAREKLQRHIQVFMNEKLFEGCGGLELTREIRLVIAALACMLILEETSDYYPGLNSILVYPEAYRAPVFEENTGGVVTEGWESRSGESWNPGNIVLSWGDIREELRNQSRDRNLVYHEFAHQLDNRYGLSAGIDAEGHTESEDEWTVTLAAVYRKLRRKALRGERDVLDLYGAENPAECFAVATECFLGRPQSLRREHADLYTQLVAFYGYDPAKLSLDAS